MWQFTRCWLVAAAVTIVLAVPCLWLRCFAFTRPAPGCLAGLTALTVRLRLIVDTLWLRLMIDIRTRWRGLMALLQIPGLCRMKLVVCHWGEMPRRIWRMGAVARRKRSDQGKRARDRARGHRSW